MTSPGSSEHSLIRLTDQPADRQTSKRNALLRNQPELTIPLIFGHQMLHSSTTVYIRNCRTYPVGHDAITPLPHAKNHAIPTLTQLKSNLTIPLDARPATTVSHFTATTHQNG
jgi:hypothetical protein